MSKQLCIKHAFSITIVHFSYQISTFTAIIPKIILYVLISYISSIPGYIAEHAQQVIFLLRSHLSPVLIRQFKIL